MILQDMTELVPKLIGEMSPVSIRYMQPDSVLI